MSTFTLVRPCSAVIVERLVPVRGLPDDLQIGGRGHEYPKTSTDERLIIGEDDADGQAPPPRHQALGYAGPGLMCVLDALAPSVPALITDDLHDVLAQNPLNVTLLGALSTARGLDSNFLWRWFTDVDLRST